MDPGKIKESVYLAFLSALSVPFSSAQITEGSGGFGGIGGGGVGNTGVEASLVEFANTILLFQVGSAADVLLYFVAPMAGFYFVQKNMLSYGFELFEERIDRHTYGRTDDDVPNGIKGLSIVTGFITVQMLGMFGAGFLLATGLLSVLLAFLMQFGLLEGALDWGGDGGGHGGGGVGNTGGNNNGGGQGGQQTQTGGGGGGGNINWGQVGQTAANFANNVNQAQQNRNHNKIENALDVFSPGTDIIDIIDEEPSDFRDHVQHIKDGKKDDASDVNSLEEVDERMQDIESEMSYLETAFGRDSNKAYSNGGLDWSNNSKLHSYDYSALLQKLVNVNNELKRIKNNQKNQASNLHDHLDESWDDIQIYIKIHEFMDKLPGGPNRVANRDNLLDHLAQEASNRNQLGSRSIQQGKSDFRSVLQNLANFESAHKSIIQNLESELSDELSIDKTEGDELNRISSEEEKIVKAAKDIKQGIEDIRNNIGISNESSPTSSDVESRMDQIKSLGNEIDNNVQDIYSIVESEGKFENKSYKKLKNLS